VLRTTSADGSDGKGRTMMLPGFTAEAGLDHHVDRYRGAADAPSVEPNGSITPASGITIAWGSDCASDCLLAPVTGGWCWCMATW
jgi:hypothetical protein